MEAKKIHNNLNSYKQQIPDTINVTTAEYSMLKFKYLSIYSLEIFHFENHVSDFV